ncbi:MAG: ABC transporter ATP-binding protein [Spirochaetales bacterium]|nr:ABC transporter ATP-binding protein [Spirochaetales bacterium]
MGAALSFEDVSVVVGSKALIEGINFELQPGTVTALVGPNGAGKTTLLRAAALLRPASSGMVLWNQRPAQEYSHAEASRFRRWCSEDEGSSMSVLGVLSAGAYPLEGRWVDLSENQLTRVQELCAQLEIDPLLNDPRSFLTFSQGERRLFHLVRTFLLPAPLYLLDEPSAPLDLRHKILVAELFRQVVGQGSAILASYHDLQEASLVADQIMGMSQGKLFAHGSAAQALSSENIQRVWRVRTPQHFPEFWSK